MIAMNVSHFFKICLFICIFLIPFQGYTITGFGFKTEDDKLNANIAVLKCIQSLSSKKNLKEKKIVINGKNLFITIFTSNFSNLSLSIGFSKTMSDANIKQGIEDKKIWATRDATKPIKQNEEYFYYAKTKKTEPFRFRVRFKPLKMIPSIAYFSSCRAHGPLRLLDQQRKVKLVLHGLGYAHNTSEINQQIRLVGKKRGISEHLWKYISSPSRKYHTYMSSDPFAFNKIKLFVIEVSSRKVLYTDSDPKIVEPTYFHVNCLRRQLFEKVKGGADFLKTLTDTSRTEEEKDLKSRLWKFTTNKTDSKPFPARPKGLLKYAADHIKMKIMTQDEIIEGIREIAQSIGGRAPILLVPHIDIVTEDGREIIDRALINSAVSRVKEELGDRFHVFRQGDLVRMHGQKNALLEDTVHYNPDFIPVVADAMYKKIQTALAH